MAKKVKIEPNTKAITNIKVCVISFSSSLVLATAFTHQGVGILWRTDLLKTKNQQIALMTVKMTKPITAN